MKICNLIKSEFSGNAGERKAFWSIDTIRCKKTVLKNVEFRNGEHRTELDGIVFTVKAIFVIEVRILTVTSTSMSEGIIAASGLR